MKARYYFKATYFPTNDSLLIEPLNAAVQEDAEFNAHTDWKASKACTQYFENDYTVANTFEILVATETSFSRPSDPPTFTI